MSSTTQDYDATKDASSYEQRGVQKYDGAGDHDGKRWLVCKDEINSALETWSRRAKAIVTGAQDDITAANVDFEGHVMFDDMRDGFHGSSKKEADSLYNKDYVWTVDYISKDVHRVKQDVVSRKAGPVSGYLGSSLGAVFGRGVVPGPATVPLPGVNQL